MEVFIPQTGDLSYDRYLEEAEREKTLDQLKKSPPRAPSKASKKDIGEALKEIKEFQRRKKENRKRFY